MTLRQRRVLGYLLAGRQNKEIAAALNITEQTVKNDVHEVFLYFGISHTRQLFPIIDRAKQECAITATGNSDETKLPLSS